MTIGERIKKVRNQLGMSQVSFADKIGVSKQTLYKYENNIVTNIPSDKIEIIAEIGGTTPSYLMGWTEEGFEFSTATKFENILKYSNENNVPLSELMDGRDIQPCDYEGIPNARVNEVKMNYDKRLGLLESEPYIEEINTPDGSYYLDEESLELANFAFQNPEYKVLFDATRKVKPNDIKKALKAIGIVIDDDEE